MKRIAYSQQLHGHLASVGPGLADVELKGAHKTPLGAAATLTAQLAFTTRHSFQAQGTIAVDGRPALGFHTFGPGVLAPSPDEDLRHGSAMFDAWGIGPLSGARGQITSNFVLAADGALTDDQVVVLFINTQGEEPL